MDPKWWHVAIVLLIGYAIGYAWPKLGTVTLGKVGIAQGS